MNKTSMHVVYDAASDGVAALSGMLELVRLNDPKADGSPMLAVRVEDAREAAKHMISRANSTARLGADAEHLIQYMADDLRRCAAMVQHEHPMRERELRATMHEHGGILLVMTNMIRAAK